MLSAVSDWLFAGLAHPGPATNRMELPDPSSQLSYSLGWVPVLRTLSIPRCYLVLLP